MNIPRDDPHEKTLFVCKTMAIGYIIVKSHIMENKFLEKDGYNNCYWRKKIQRPTRRSF